MAGGEKQGGRTLLPGRKTLFPSGDPPTWLLKDQVLTTSLPGFLCSVALAWNEVGGLMKRLVVPRDLELERQCWFKVHIAPTIS